MIEIEITPRWTIRYRGERQFDFVLVKLLQAIKDTERLTDAAQRAGISYRHAWNVIEKWGGFFGSPLVLEPAAGRLTGGAGLLPVRPFDQRIGLTPQHTARLNPTGRRGGELCQRRSVRSLAVQLLEAVDGRRGVRRLPRPLQRRRNSPGERQKKRDYRWRSRRGGPPIQGDSFKVLD